MANYRAIAATSTALRGLIRDHYPRAEFGAGLDVLLYQTRDFEEPMQDGFSITCTASPSTARCAT